MEMGTTLRRIDDRLPECISPRRPEPRHLYHLDGWLQEGSGTDREIQLVVLVKFTVALITRTSYPAGTGSSVMEVFW